MLLKTLITSKVLKKIGGGINTMNKKLIMTAGIALIFSGIWAVAAESNLNTFTLRADKILTDYIGGNATSDKVNITGLIIHAGQVLGYYNESATDTLLDAKSNQSDLTAHIDNITSNPHGVTTSQIGAAATIHDHSLGVSNVSGLQGILDNKYNKSETDALLGGKADAADLTSHTSASNNPHSVTIGQIGAATSSHNHSGSEITDAVSSATDADMVDNYHAGNAANNVLVLDSSGSVPFSNNVWFIYGNSIRRLVDNTGTTLLTGDDTSVSVSNTVYTKSHEIRLHKTPSSSLKIFFTLGYGGGGTCYGQIYRDGAAVGTERTVSAGSYSGSETIAGWSDGDYVQLYVKGTTSPWCSAYNFRILGTVNIQGVP